MDWKKCELCTAQAALYCAADDAHVCWDCDEQVHSANFLVARHHRSVLCQNCGSPTLLRASGARFHPTSSLCPSCSSGNIQHPHRCNNKRKTACKRPDVSMVRSTSLSLRGSDIISSKLEHSDQSFLDQDCSHNTEQCTCMVLPNKNVLASLTSYSNYDNRRKIHFDTSQIFLRDYDNRRRIVCFYDKSQEPVSDSPISFIVEESWSRQSHTSDLSSSDSDSAIPQPHPANV